MSNDETHRKLAAACQEVLDAMYRAEHVLSNPRSRGSSKAKAELLATAANLEAMAVELSPKLSTTVDRVVRAAHELVERVAAPRKGEKRLEAMTPAGKVLQRSLTDLYDALNPPPRTPMEKLDRLERDVKTALVWLRPLRKSHQEMGWPNSE